jgi:hypothetical protein
MGPPRISVDLNASNVLMSMSAVNASASGNNTLIAGSTGTVIRVWRLVLAPAATVLIQLLDGSTVLFGPMTLVTSGLQLPFDSQPYVTTSPGNNLVLNLGGATQTGGAIYFTQG